MSKKLTPFTVLFDLPKKKLYTREEVKQSGLNIHLLLNFLKFHPIGVSIAEYINRNWSMNIYDMYLFAFYVLPKQVTRINYRKKDVEEKIVDLDIIKEHYMVDDTTAKEYLSLIDDKTLNKIKYMAKIRKGKK